MSMLTAQCIVAFVSGAFTVFIIYMLVKIFEELDKR